jgi:hypothetical protein
MANSTHVFFYREAVMMSKLVPLQLSTGRYELSLGVFINACVAQARIHAKEGNSDGALDILGAAEAQLFPDHSNHKSSLSRLLEEDGVKGITTFRTMAVFEDIEIIAPKVIIPLRNEVQSWVILHLPRLPIDSETPFRLLLKNIAHSGMFFFDKKELEQLVNAVESVTDELVYAEEWKEVIMAHRSEQYDLALFSTPFC